MSVKPLPVQSNISNSKSTYAQRLPGYHGAPQRSAHHTLLSNLLIFLSCCASVTCWSVNYFNCMGGSQLSTSPLPCVCSLRCTPRSTYFKVCRRGSSLDMPAPKAIHACKTHSIRWHRSNLAVWEPFISVTHTLLLGRCNARDATPENDEP